MLSWVLMSGRYARQKSKIEIYFVDVKSVFYEGHAFGPAIFAILEVHLKGIDNLI